ncbi:hypothetical protein [Prauserella muralis]|uniref:Uncharacterized protein n=1 Tax=Prauserella muralis TaxID=588067 RepID=A0A2V4B991_9PSEU|nr:hypothetical protein [Prauserella muralis]PXY31810.1 hypothetical protein BAY60_05595 [Prauserella muralis]TWE13784.1 hypothetical protein FHX69_5912 [Prauserella muralis]
MTRQSDLRAFLRSLDTETLADLLCEQAERDPELRRRLQARADGARHGELAAVSNLLEDAVRASESVQVTSVLDTLQRLLDAGTQADVAPLARRTVDKITSAFAGSDEQAGVVGDQLDRAVSLYARACAAHPPKPRELADWILRVAFDRPGWPGISLVEFAQPLGDKGLARVKSVVDDVLAEPDSGQDPVRRRTAQRLNQEHAEVTGDVDTVVRMLSEQLPRRDVSLKIVRVLRAAGRHAEAIAYAAKALGTGNGATRGQVVATLEAEHAAAAAAVEEPAPEPRAPEPAETVSGAAVPKQPEPGQPEPEPVGEPAEQAGTVRALLAEDRADEAWKAAADVPPADVVPVYRDHIEALVAQREAQSYVKAAAALRRLRILHRRAGSPDEFTAYLGELVETHRRKTRLVEEIRKARIAVPKAVRR